MILAVYVCVCLYLYMCRGMIMSTYQEHRIEEDYVSSEVDVDGEALHQHDARHHGAQCALHWLRQLLRHLHLPHLTLEVEALNCIP